MQRHHIYNITVQWTGNKGSGTSGYREFDRSHSIIIDHKPDILCSSDPAFRGDKTKQNPEELLVSSLSSCHMLWYLHLCADAGIIVQEYTDHARGSMIEGTDGGGRFAEVILHPTVMVSESSMVEKANELHKKANQLCFIANSVNFPVRHHPTAKVATADTE